MVGFAPVATNSAAAAMKPIAAKGQDARAQSVKAVDQVGGVRGPGENDDAEQTAQAGHHGVGEGPFRQHAAKRFEERRRGVPSDSAVQQEACRAGLDEQTDTRAKTP